MKEKARTAVLFCSHCAQASICGSDFLRQFVTPGWVQNLVHIHLPGVQDLLSYSNSTMRELPSMTKSIIVIIIIIIIIFLQYAV